MDEYPASMSGAVVGGVIVASLSHPMDTIKTCQVRRIKSPLRLHPPTLLSPLPFPACAVSCPPGAGCHVVRKPLTVFRGRETLCACVAVSVHVSIVTFIVFSPLCFPPLHPILVLAARRHPEGAVRRRGAHSYHAPLRVWPVALLQWLVLAHGSHRHPSVPLRLQQDQTFTHLFPAPL